MLYIFHCRGPNNSFPCPSVLSCSIGTHIGLLHLLPEFPLPFLVLWVTSIRLSLSSLTYHLTHLQLCTCPQAQATNYLEEEKRPWPIHPHPRQRQPQGFVLDLLLFFPFALLGLNLRKHHTSVLGSLQLFSNVSF